MVKPRLIVPFDLPFKQGGLVTDKFCDEPGSTFNPFWNKPQTCNEDAKKQGQQGIEPPLPCEFTVYNESVYIYQEQYQSGNGTFGKYGKSCETAANISGPLGFSALWEAFSERKIW